MIDEPAEPSRKQPGAISQRWRVLGMLAGLGVVAASVTLAVLRPWHEPPPIASRSLAATLELAAGEVILHKEQASVRVLSRTPLPEGATISTAKGARAMIRLGDGSRVFLDESTTLELGAGARVVEGRAWLDAPPLEHEHEATVHRIGAAAVTLANGGVSLSWADGTARIYVADGLAVVTSPGGRTEVEAGERAIVVGDGAPEVEPVAFWEDWTGGMGDRGTVARSTGIGSGSLYAVDRQAPAGSRALPLSIQRQTVHVVVRDAVAETMVDQHFFNPGARDVEGYYWFTIPENSQLIGFALETNGELVEGEIVERGEAAATYEAAIARANDPALLEWIDERTVRARIHPMPALGTRRIVVRYQQLLTEQAGRLRYSYPLAGPAGTEAPTIEEFALQVDLGVLASTHDVTTLAEARIEDQGRRVTMRRSGYTPRVDFELELARKDAGTVAPLRLNLVDPGGDQARYIMVRYAPDLDFDAVPAPTGDIVVVVDTSAAGDEAEYRTRVAVAEALLRSLSAGDRFALMSADVTATVLHPETGLADAEPAAISAALERLAQHGTGGATDLGAIFELALERVHGREQPAIVYVGDGLATSGERGGDELAERLRRSMTGSRARLFTVGVGADVDEGMLARLARVGGGATLRVEAAEHAVLRALELAGALKTPTITDLELDLGQGLDDVFVGSTGKLSKGQELVLLARTHHDLPDEVAIRGRLGGQPFERKYELERERGVTDHIVPRLWAGAFVERLRGDSRGPEAVRGKILSLGLEYGIMTPHTSFLALDNELAYAQTGIGRRPRRFGGVRLTDATSMRGTSPSTTRGSAVVSGLAAALLAPLGCTAKSEADDVAHERVPAETPARSATPGSSATATPDVATPGASGSTPSMPASAPPPPADGFRGGDVPAAHEAPEESAAFAPSTGLVGGGGGPAADPTSEVMPYAVGEKTEGSAGLDGRRVSARAKNAERRTDKDEDRRDLEQRATRPAVASPVAKHRALPCSDAASRTLEHRKLLWRKRLARTQTMIEALDAYEAAAGSCEIDSWKDQRVFLQLLQARAATEGDVEILLAHFWGEADAQRYVARALLRRLVEPGLVAAVHRSLFGTAVDWNDVDRRLALEIDAARRLNLVQQAMARSPGDPEGERRLLELLVRDGKIDEAIARGRRLREQGIMTPLLAQRFGEILVAHRRPDEARRVFSEIVEFDPHGPRSRALLGDIFLRHRWYEAAYRQYQDLSALVPEDAPAIIRVARAAAGAARVDEALRLLRKVAAGEGRPGVDDPRRWARLHAAVLLAELLRTGGKDVSQDALSRELKRLALFDAPATWKLVIWEDLQADLKLVPSDPSRAPTWLADATDAGSTGLFAAQIAGADAAEAVLVRHGGPVLDRDVDYAVVTLRWDGNEFSVTREEGKVERGVARPAVAAVPGGGSQAG